MNPREPFLIDPRQIKAWLNSMGVKNFKITKEGLVNVEGDVDLTGRLSKLERLPVRFGKVGGNFCCRASHLVSLMGVPKEVGGDFSCSNNQVVSLEGAPAVVGRNFYCNNNLLVSLEGAPKEVGRDFACHNNQLESLEGAPTLVGGTFYCHYNYLVDFKGMENVILGGMLVVKKLVVPDLTILGLGNTFGSLYGLPKELYNKVVGLDVQALLALEQKRASERAVSLLDANVEELSSEVELG